MLGPFDKIVRVAAREIRHSLHAIAEPVEHQVSTVTTGMERAEAGLKAEAELLPMLVEQLNQLNVNLEDLSSTLKPISSVEHGVAAVEHRVTGMFHRHHDED